MSAPSTDIYGARVTLAGKILDPAGIPISTAAGYQSLPEIAFDGTNYLVVWQGGCAATCAARVSSGGTVLDPGGIAIANGSSPALAFDGTNYLVTWAGASRVYVARVSQAGVVLDPGGIPLPGGGMYLYELNPSVAFNGTNYLVAWQEATDIIGQDHILGARVSPSGAVLEAMTITLLGGPAETSPVVASAGTNYLVVWRDHRICLRRHLRIPGQLGRHGARRHPDLDCARRARGGCDRFRRHELLRRLAGLPLGYDV